MPSRFWNQYEAIWYTCSTTLLIPLEFDRINLVIHLLYSAYSFLERFGILLQRC